MVRRELQWMLGFTALLTLIALVWAPPDSGHSSASGAPVDGSGAWPSQQAPSPTQAARPAEARALVSAEAGQLLPALSDPFAPPRPSVQSTVQAPAPAPAAAPAALPIVVTAQPTQPPPMPRLAGRMLTPAGETLIYLRDAEAIVQVSMGTVLPSGYVVEAWLPEPGVPSTAQAVRLFHPPTEHRQELHLPQHRER